RCARGVPRADQSPNEDDADDRGEGDRSPAKPGLGRRVLHTFARTARESRLLLREFGEIDAARCAFDRVSLLMSALGTVHRPSLYRLRPPPAWGQIALFARH